MHFSIRYVDYSNITNIIEPGRRVVPDKIVKMGGKNGKKGIFQMIEASLINE